MYPKMLLCYSVSFLLAPLSPHPHPLTLTLTPLPSPSPPHLHPYPHPLTLTLTPTPTLSLSPPPPHSHPHPHPLTLTLTLTPSPLTSPFHPYPDGQSDSVTFTFYCSRYYLAILNFLRTITHIDAQQTAQCRLESTHLSEVFECIVVSADVLSEDDVLTVPYRGFLYLGGP